MKVVASLMIGAASATATESLTEYDRSTIGLDDLMGDMNSQINEMRNFQSSVFFHQAQMQGLGSHLNKMDPFAKVNQVPEVVENVPETMAQEDSESVLPVRVSDEVDTTPRSAPKLSGDAPVDPLPMFMLPQNAWVYPFLFVIVALCCVVVYQSQQLAAQRKK